MGNPKGRPPQPRRWTATCTSCDLVQSMVADATIGEDKPWDGPHRLRREWGMGRDDPRTHQPITFFWRQNISLFLKGQIYINRFRRVPHVSKLCR